MNDNPIRRAVDTRLSGLAFTPQMQADTLRRARLCNQTPHMRRKLSYSLAFALLALLLAATAGAAAYFGVLRFHAEQESNAAYQQHILPIGERLTGSSTAMRRCAVRSSSLRMQASSWRMSIRLSDLEMPASRTKVKMEVGV